MPDALDRILILEERARVRAEILASLEVRMHKLERTVWIGVGILACLQFLVPMLLDRLDNFK